jgi:adenosine deaminase
VARAARRAGIDVRFIATFGRHFTLRENGPTLRAVEGTDIFSALDIAGDEGRSALPFLPFFRKAGLPATIHAGEAGGAGNVREAIERFGARRIGHGVRVLEDPSVVRLAREKSVVFETCLTSEILTGAARSWRRHPVRAMIDAGLRVTLNTDDPSVCGVSLSDELRRAGKAGLRREEIRQACIEAASSAFRPSAQRVSLRRRIEKSWI